MKYYIAGDRGLVGSHYYKLGLNASGGNTSTVDYTDKRSVFDEIEKHTPTHVVINAATVGGLQEDLDHAFELMIRNMTIQNNILEACDHFNVDRVLLQGSICSYPHSAAQPYAEEQLMTGEPYQGYLPTAMPKLVGMYQCRAINEKKARHWRTAINTNMFGPNDRSGEHAHVIGALMSKFAIANKNSDSTVEIWGSGNQSRDIMFIDDAVNAMDIVLNNDIYDTVNVCSGVEITIRELAEAIKTVSGYSGNLWFNTDRPTGVMRRAVDNTRLTELGWRPQYSLEDALATTYRWYYDNL
jgi:GDP-L-fucose synthase